MSRKLRKFKGLKALLRKSGETELIVFSLLIVISHLVGHERCPHGISKLEGIHAFESLDNNIMRVSKTLRISLLHGPAIFIAHIQSHSETVLVQAMLVLVINVRAVSVIEGLVRRLVMPILL